MEGNALKMPALILALKPGGEGGPELRQPFL
jgi:hypothetical protein